MIYQNVAMLLIAKLIFEETIHHFLTEKDPRAYLRLYNPAQTVFEWFILLDSV